MDFDSRILEEQCRTDLQLERSRRLHTHDLIFKVMTAYVTITLAALGAAGFFLRERATPSISLNPDAVEEGKLYPLSLAIVVLGFGFLVGILHHVYLLNLRVDRDIHRLREKLFRNAIDHLIRKDANGACFHYRTALSYSRGSKNFGLDKRKTSLFSMFGAFIYVGNVVLLSYMAWFLFHDDVISEIFAVVMVLFFLLVHSVLVNIYLFSYISAHRKQIGSHKDRIAVDSLLPQESVKEPTSPNVK